MQLILNNVRCLKIPAGGLFNGQPAQCSSHMVFLAQPPQRRKSMSPGPEAFLGLAEWPEESGFRGKNSLDKYVYICYNLGRFCCGLKGRHLIAQGKR